MDLNDVKSIILLIDTCVQRGAFRGDEMTTIGNLRDKLVLATQAAANPQETPDEENDS